MEEKTFLDEGGIKVTNTRLIFASQTFPVTNISSVSTFKIQKRFWPKILIKRRETLCLSKLTLLKDLFR
jgi:hypothetical protein